MILHDEIALLRACIARRVTERDALRASGRQDRYLAAYCDLESLELQLEQLRRQGAMEKDARAPLCAPGVRRAVIAEMDGDAPAALPRRAGGVS